MTTTIAPMTPRKMTAMKTLMAAVLPAALLAGCLQGPEYAPPRVNVPQEFRGAATTPADAASLADQPWWEVFQDPALQALIDEALKNNYDVQTAVARIERARAMVGVVNSQAQPQIGYQMGAGGQKSFIPTPGQSGDTLTYGAVGSVFTATWELDVWGRIKRSTEAAQANLAQQEDIRRGVMLTLVSDLATHYFRLLELDRELAIAQESSDTFKQTVDFFTIRFEAGRDNRLPVDRSQALYDASNAKIADLRRAIAQEENAISELAGANPRAVMRGLPLGGQTLPATPLGATTALLQRRPDILAAEQTMKRANAEIGVALAERFPRIGLSALVGGVAAGIDGNWSGFSTWNLAADLAGPLYTGGRLTSIYQERQAFWDETVAQYRKTVVVAFRETADALAAQENLGAQRAAQEAQVAALRRSTALARFRYKEGRASYFEVLEAEQQLFPAEDALARTQRDQLLAVVSLYKALGGGWNPAAEQRNGTQQAAVGG